MSANLIIYLIVAVADIAMVILLARDLHRRLRGERHD